jgi:phage terminase small subunit
MSTMTKLIKDTKEKMKSLGVYQPEFDTSIEIYCSLIEQYKMHEKDLKKQKLQLVDSPGLRKFSNEEQLLKALEKLRKDILAYSTALGLTPAALKRINAKQKIEKQEQSKLEMALEHFGT